MNELGAISYWLNCLLPFLIQLKKDTYFMACDRVGTEKITYQGTSCIIKLNNLKELTYLDLKETSVL
jgi:hypothetical protein